MAIGGIGLIIGILLTTAVGVLAGSINPSGGPADPGSQMYTLEQIYQRLVSGAAGTKMAAFTEPSSAPGGTMHTLDQIMAAAPTVDEANGARAADVASGKTFWGLTAGAWGLQAGTASSTANPAEVARTGQQTSYVDGDDGDLRRGVAWPNPRFTDNSDGTVTDNLTGLIWLKDADCFTARQWSAALAAANTLNDGECGLDDGSAEGDWRLPNVLEMQSLIHFGVTDHPALPNTAGTGKWTEGDPFTGVRSAYYWTSTADANTTTLAWFLGLHSGDTYQDLKTSNSWVWPVRGGQ